MTIEFIVFVVFGSGEEQPWNKTQQKKDTERGVNEEITPLKGVDSKNGS